MGAAGEGWLLGGGTGERLGVARGVSERYAEVRGKARRFAHELPPFDAIEARHTRALLQQSCELAAGAAGHSPFSDPTPGVMLSEIFGNNPDFAVAHAVQTCVAPFVMSAAGEPRHRDEVLPALRSGRLIAAFAATEEGAGADILNVRTAATLDHDGRHYRLNGTKIWVRNAGIADLLTVLAAIDGHTPALFLVDAREPGISVASVEPPLGLQGLPLGVVALEGVRVPVRDRLGTGSSTPRLLAATRAMGRLHVSAIALGLCREFLSRAVDRAGARRQFGRAIGEFGAVQRRLAEMFARVWLGEAVVYRTAAVIGGAVAARAPVGDPLIEAVGSCRIELCAANLLLGGFASRSATDLVEIFGGRGLVHGSFTERAYRDARMLRILEGTDDLVGLELLEAVRSRFPQEDVDALRAGGRGRSGPRQVVDRLRALLAVLIDEHSGDRGNEAEAQQIDLALAELTTWLYALDAAVERAAGSGAAALDAAPVDGVVELSFHLGREAIQGALREIRLSDRAQRLASQLDRRLAHLIASPARRRHLLAVSLLGAP